MLRQVKIKRWHWRSSFLGLIVFTDHLYVPRSFFNCNKSIWFIVGEFKPQLIHMMLYLFFASTFNFLLSFIPHKLHTIVCYQILESMFYHELCNKFLSLAMTWLFFQDVVDGSVVVNSASSISHQGIRLTAVGTIMLQVRNPPQLSPQSFSLKLSWFIHWIQTYFSCYTSFWACRRHWNQAILLRSTYFLGAWLI